MLYDFIVVDDNEYFLVLMDKTIKNLFKQKGLKCNTYLFNDYNQDFYDIMYTYKNNKVYILDIETPSANGVEIAKKIRKNDLASNIIFVSAYEEDYFRQIFRSDSRYFSSLSKKDLEKNLTIKLKKLLNQIPNKVLSIRVGDDLYKIIEDDIIYVKYENRKTIIITSENEIHLNKQLKELYNFLSNNFVYSHKACIVNMTKVREYSLIAKEIIFEDNIKTDLISRKYISNLDDYYKIKI